MVPDLGSRRRRPARLLVLGALLAVAAFVAIGRAGDDATSTAEELVARLPATASVRQPGEVHRALVAMGDDALPALRAELRPGIRSKAVMRLQNEGRSRRYAAALVLAEIDSPASTALLVRCLADPADNFAMRGAMVRAVAARVPTDAQIVALLGNEQSDVLLAAIGMALERADRPEIRGALERLFDPDSLQEQMTNEFGHPVGSEAHRWQVRLATGRALGVDMASEIRARVSDKVDGLLAVLSDPPENRDDLAWPSYLTVEESAIFRVCAELVEMRDEARPFLSEARAKASGDAARVLDMALLRCGDDGRVTAVCETLLEGRAALRVCAAMTLRHAGAESAKPALWKALKDDLRRPQGGCIEPQNEHHPVRTIAAGALVALGEDVEKVRAATR